MGNCLPLGEKTGTRLLRHVHALTRDQGDVLFWRRDVRKLVYFLGLPIVIFHSSFPGSWADRMLFALSRLVASE